MKPSNKVQDEKGLMNSVRKIMEKHFFKVCPKSGRFIGVRAKAWWFFPLLGIPALVWFMLRVLPKPSRLSYPCQQVVTPIAGSFLLWLLGISGAAVAFRNARKHLRNKSYAIALGSLAIGACWLVFNVSMHPVSGHATAAAYKFTPTDGVNNPMGTATGLYPGRVVWVRDAAATTWDGTSNYWFNDANNNQPKINAMMSKILQTYTEKTTDADAWNALFKYFNIQHNRGNTGYTKGEKIVIKINLVVNTYNSNTGYPSPHVINALVSQLIEGAGVSGTDITITDPSQKMPALIYNKIRSNTNPEFKNVWFADNQELQTDPQKVFAGPDTTSKLFITSTLDGKTQKQYYVPECFTKATYVINLALLRPHRRYGVTLTTKNNFGSIYDISLKKCVPSGLHAFFVDSVSGPRMGSVHPHPSVQGHKDLGGKELVQMFDALYMAENNNGAAGIVKWSTFGNGWMSSLFMSQDPVAIQSVGLDLLLSEPNMTATNTSLYDPDNFLHEMSMANNPPSKAVYDPDKDGSILPSLGVHEHWNNAIDRQYSRNISPGTGKGIELIYIAGSTNLARPVSPIAANPGTKIETLGFASGKMVVDFSLPEAGMVTVEVLTLQGQIVAKSDRQFTSAGRGSIVATVGNYSSGSNRYVVRLSTHRGIVSKTMTIMQGSSRGL